MKLKLEYTSDEQMRIDAISDQLAGPFLSEDDKDVLRRESLEIHKFVEKRAELLREQRAAARAAVEESITNQTLGVECLAPLRAGTWYSDITMDTPAWDQMHPWEDYTGKNYWQRGGVGLPERTPTHDNFLHLAACMREFWRRSLIPSAVIGRWDADMLSLSEARMRHILKPECSDDERGTALFAESKLVAEQAKRNAIQREADAKNPPATPSLSTRAFFDILSAGLYRLDTAEKLAAAGLRDKPEKWVDAAKEFARIEREEKEKEKLAAERAKKPIDGLADDALPARTSDDALDDFHKTVVNPIY